METAYDIIGDVHGQAGKLTALLAGMGYIKEGGAWRHPERTAVFLGDFIDRGPHQIETVDIVRRMVDAGAARAVMGNHELNAIAFATSPRERPTAFLRPHSEKNVGQHAEFLRQVGEGSDLHRELVAWFRTLPLFLDLGDFRAVHAWWHQPHIDTITASLGSAGVITDEFLFASHKEGSAEYDAVQEITKGFEIDLPEGCTFVDHQGERRSTARVEWWKEDARTYRDGARIEEDQRRFLPDSPLPADVPLGVTGDAPVFVGHYWLEGAPAPRSPKVACLDYSAGKEGPLVAYRWDGESELNARNFFHVGSQTRLT